MMQDALQAAVTRINNGNGSAEPQAAAPENTFGAIMSALPKLLRSNESSEDVLEKLDALQNGGLTPLLEQVQRLRKHVKLLLKSQEQVLGKLDEMQRQQSAVARVVLNLARQMARITFVEDGPTGDDDYEREGPPAHEAYRRAEPRTNGNGRGRSPRETPTAHGPNGRAGRSR